MLGRTYTTSVLLNELSYVIDDSLYASPSSYLCARTSRGSCAVRNDATALCFDTVTARSALVVNGVASAFVGVTSTVRSSGSLPVSGDATPLSTDAEATVSVTTSASDDVADADTGDVPTEEVVVTDERDVDAPQAVALAETVDDVDAFPSGCGAVAAVIDDSETVVGYAPDVTDVAVAVGTDDVAVDDVFTPDVSAVAVDPVIDDPGVVDVSAVDCTDDAVAVVTDPCPTSDRSVDPESGDAVVPVTDADAVIDDPAVSPDAVVDDTDPADCDVVAPAWRSMAVALETVDTDVFVVVALAWTSLAVALLTDDAFVTDEPDVTAEAVAVDTDPAV